MTLPPSLRRAYALTYIGLIAERVTHAAWPLWTVVFAGLAVWGLGILGMMPPLGVTVFMGIVLLGLGYGVWYGRTFRWPLRAEVFARLDATMPGRPIQALADTQTFGEGDPASRAVWQAHLKRMEAKLSGVRPVEPDLRVSAADPFALRYFAAIFLAVAVLFGGVWRGSDLTSGLGVGPVDALPAGPMWEAWLEPPRYTGKPTLYLPDLIGGAVDVPQGTRVTVRLYGEVGTLSVVQSVTEVPLSAVDPVAFDFTVSKSGSLSIIGPDTDMSWDIEMLADTVPVIFPETPPTVEPPSQMLLPFGVVDDYGMVAGQAVIDRDLSALDRRYGLAVEPDPRAPLELDLPLPISGDRDSFSEVLVEDVSKHPFAELPVVLVLRAEDALGQEGFSEPLMVVLPGRSFFDPLANALIEQRRDLLWARANGARVAQILRTLTHRADDTYTSPAAFILVRMAIRRLEANPDLTVTQQDEIADLLWEAALKIEEGTLSSALERLRRAQERLSEAIRQGAEPAEIDQLMQELREAMNEYMRQRLAEQQRNAQNGEQDQQQGQQGERQEVTQDQLDQLLERIEELMREGRTAEAQELLQQLQEMMENMEVQQGQGGEGQQGEGEQAMEGLRETLREQQGLSDEAFRDLQEQFNPNAQAGESQDNVGRNGGQGEGESHEGQGGQGEGGDEQQGEGQGAEGSLAQRQQALRDQLGQLQRNLPGQGTPEGDAARDALGRAEQAMDDAAQSLEQGDLPGAIDDQAQAMDALREGMQNLGEAMAQEQQDGQGQQGDQFGENAQPQQRDPLGRQPGATGRLGTDDNLLQGDDPRRRARDLMDEIRRRSAEQDRPELERDYLKRLLDRF